MSHTLALFPIAKTPLPTEMLVDDSHNTQSKQTQLNKLTRWIHMHFFVCVLPSESVVDFGLFVRIAKTSRATNSALDGNVFRRSVTPGYIQKSPEDYMENINGYNCDDRSNFART